MPDTYSLKLINESVVTQSREPSHVLRQYRVTKSGSVINPALDVAQMMTSGDIPAMLSPLAASFDRATLRQTMRFRGVVDVQKAPKSAGDKLDMVLKWDTEYVSRADVASGTTVLPSGRLRSGSLRYGNFWRLGWSVGPSATSAFPDVEITGTKVDTALEPVRGVIPQGDDGIWWMIDSKLTDVQSIIANATEYEGTINNDTFLGYAQGYLLCQNIDVQKYRDEIYLCVMRVLYDAYYHHEQRPRNEPDGKPILHTTGQAKEVVWARPYSVLKNFNAISGSLIGADQLYHAQHGEYGTYTP